jgi:hypothetical protein
MRPLRPFIVVVTALAATALVACTTIDSGAVATSDVQPRIRVVVDETGTAQVSVALLSGFANVLELQAGELLSARLGAGAPVALTVGDGEVFGAPTAYFATLNGAMPGNEIVLSWSRPDQESAPDTRIVVPPTLAGVATSGTAFEFDDDVMLFWTPDGSGDAVDVRLRLVACDGLDADEFAAARFLAGFPSTFAIADGAGTFEPALLAGAATSCDAVLEVGRSREAIDLDPAFDGLRDRSSVVHLAAEIPVVFVAP